MKRVLAWHRDWLTGYVAALLSYEIGRREENHNRWEIALSNIENSADSETSTGLCLTQTLGDSGLIQDLIAPLSEYFPVLKKYIWRHLSAFCLPPRTIYQIQGDGGYNIVKDGKILGKLYMAVEAWGVIMMVIIIDDRAHKCANYTHKVKMQML